LKIREDTSIEPGGCKIVTNFGIIDAQISTQLDQIKEKLLEKKDKIKKVIDGEEG
jgi:flagellar assembly protein FliH